MKLLGQQSENFLNRLMSRQTHNDESKQQRTNIGLSYSFIIASDWVQANDNAAWTCAANRLYFDTETRQYISDNQTTYQIFNAATGTKPDDATGKTIRAIYNGNWELI